MPLHEPRLDKKSKLLPAIMVDLSDLVAPTALKVKLHTTSETIRITHGLQGFRKSTVMPKKMNSIPEQFIHPMKKSMP